MEFNRFMIFLFVNCYFLPCGHYRIHFKFIYSNWNKKVENSSQQRLALGLHRESLDHVELISCGFFKKLIQVADLLCMLFWLKLVTWKISDYIVESAGLKKNSWHEMQKNNFLDCMSSLRILYHIKKKSILYLLICPEVGLSLAAYPI